MIGAAIVLLVGFLGGRTSEFFPTVCLMVYPRVLFVFSPWVCRHHPSVFGVQVLQDLQIGLI